MRLARITLASLALATVLAAPIAAQGVATSNGDARVRLTNVGAGVSYNFTNDVYGAVYVGHYGFSFVNGPYGSYASMPGLSANFDAWCVDFDTNVSLNQQWNVNLTRLSETNTPTPTPNLTGTRLVRSASQGGEGLTSTQALYRYRQAAWLTTQFALYANHSERASVWGAIHAAIWSITGANNPQPNTTNTNASSIFSRAYWLNGGGTPATASTIAARWSYNVSRVNPFEYIVMTAYPNSTTAQEFLIRNPTVVPEPATMLLLGSGLAGMGIAGLRRRRKNKNPESQDCSA
jgi:hypothetical protein